MFLTGNYCPSLFLAFYVLFNMCIPLVRFRFPIQKKRIILNNNSCLLNSFRNEEIFTPVFHLWNGPAWIFCMFSTLTSCE